MTKFKDIIRVDEMAIAQEGNLKDYGNFITDYKKSAVNEFMTLIDNTIKIKGLSYTFELYKINNRKINQPDFILGIWVDTELDTKVGIEKKSVFRAIWAVQISKRVLQGFRYTNVINIDGVFTYADIEFARRGISTFMYQYLVNTLHYTILGDLEQYFGARKLWTGLSKIHSMQVDVIDLNTNKVIIDNAILIHGEKDDEFDKRIWDTEKSQSYIANNYRCILTKINL